MMTENKRFRVTLGNNTVRFVDFEENKQLMSISFKKHNDAIDCQNALKFQCDLLNELNNEVMSLRAENTKFKLVVGEIIEDMQKYVDDDQLIYINQSYVDWIKENVDTRLYSQKRLPDD